MTDYNALVAWTGLGTAIAANYGLWAESRRHRLSMALDLILRLEDQFSTERMYANRKKVALAVLSGNFGTAANEIQELVDFFEGVGFLVRRRVLDRRLTWAFFFWYVNALWHSARPYIDQSRNVDPTVWCEFAALHKRLAKVEMRERGLHNMDADATEEQLAQF